MTSFHLLDLQEYVIKQKPTPNNDDIMVCICCTSQNTVFINLTTCSHTEFLRNIVNINIDTKNLYICNICHNMLKKIDVFKQQVQDSVALLLDQAPILKIDKLHNFQQPPIQIYGVDNTEMIKPELDDVNETPNYENLETDVKIEQASSETDTATETENEIETSIIPKDKIKSVETSNSGIQQVLYDGKIGVVILSEEELMAERKKMANSENYLKLPYKCESCIVGFDREITLKTHMEKKHTMTENSFQCKICLTVMINRLSFAEHMKRHTRRTECLICGKRYVHLLTAELHYDENHAEAGSTIQPGYWCKKCTFRSSRVHHKSYHEFKCDQCDKVFNFRVSLAKHKSRVHAKTEDGRAYCVDCNTYYQNETGLAHHLATHSRHITENDLKLGTFCSMFFIDKRKLEIHINWEHFKMNILKCPKCNKPYKCLSSLRHHIAYVHEKKKAPRNKICDYCGKAFTAHATLVCHIRTHTGERPLHCNHCPATFAHSAALYNHNKLLHGGKRK